MSDREIVLTNSFTPPMADEKNAFLDNYFAVVIRCALRFLVCQNSSTFSKVIKSYRQILCFGECCCEVSFFIILSCMFNTDDGAIGGQFAALALKL